jgi:hypothetical protein
MRISDPATRYKICKQCEHFVSFTKQCKICFCFMKIKTKFKEFKCPIKKW